jgi:hypothetical protein
LETDDSPALKEIFVRLLDEGVDVWRPIKAERLSSDTYRILDQPYDRATEAWEFGPGDEVGCEMISSSNGQILAATRLTSSG